MKRKLIKKEDGGPGDGRKPTSSDSLSLYNNAVKLNKYYNNSSYKPYGKPLDSSSPSDFDMANSYAYSEFLQNAKNHGGYNDVEIAPNTDIRVDHRLAKVTPEQYRKNIDSNRYYQRETANGILDMNAPMSLFDKRIVPQSHKILRNDDGNSVLQGDMVDLYTYDPIAVKPWDMLTPQEAKLRVQRYGNPNNSIMPTEDLQRAKVQGPIQVANSMPQIGPPTGGVGQLAGGPSNFSFTGRDNVGQQTTRYFPDLASWTNATNTMGYSNREVTNNGQQANATGYQFKDGGMKVKLTKADLGLSMPTSPLAQIGQGPAPIQAPQMYQTPGFAPSTNMQNTQQNNPNIPNGRGDINWDHVMASYVAQNLASGMVSRFSPNSQQNNMKEFNKQQFSPMNFLPYTQNNSIQAQYGTPQMGQGGQVMSDGGYFGGSDDEMRKWILGEDEATNDTPDAPQQQEQAPQYNDDALQYANFVQMMGLDQADGEKGPEDQDEGNMYGHGGPVTDAELYEILGDEASDEHLDKLAKGGWIQKASASIKRRGTKGVCTGSKFGGPSCRPGTRRYALAKTFKHMAHKRKKHEDGGPVGPDEMDLSPETIIGLIGQGYQFDV